MRCILWKRWDKHLQWAWVSWETNIFVVLFSPQCHLSGTSRDPSGCQEPKLIVLIVGVVSLHKAAPVSMLIYSWTWIRFSKLGSKQFIGCIFFFSFPTAGRRVASQRARATSHQPINRREVLRAGLESLVQQRALKELQGRPHAVTSYRKGPHSERGKADIIMKVLAWLHSFIHY